MSPFLHWVSFISTNMTLLPGAVIVTGTPTDIGPIESLLRMLRAEGALRSIRGGAIDLERRHG